MFDQPRSKQGLVHREGSGIPQNGGNGPPTVETGVLFIGRAVAYRKMDEMDLYWSATVETGVLFIGKGVAYRKTGLHGILFMSTVDLLQPPRAPVHLASTGSCSSSLHCALLHRLLFNHPPPSTVHPALHTTGCCSSRGNATAHSSSEPPRNAHCSSQRYRRSASVSSSSEGIARSGSVNSHRSIGRVQ